MRSVLLACGLCAALAAPEVTIPLPKGGAVALSTRGPASFRVRFLFNTPATPPIDTTMVKPDAPDADFEPATGERGTGIKSKFGSIFVNTNTGVLSLLCEKGNLLTATEPLGTGDADFCDGRAGDITSGDRVAPAMRVADAGACCAECKKIDACTNWIFGHPGNQEGNCWLLKNIVGVHGSTTRTIGGKGLGPEIAFSTNKALLYGKGAGPWDAKTLTATSVNPHVENRETYVPYYWSTDGYAALGVVNITAGVGKTNYFPANYGTDGQWITWSPATFPFELYLMPASTLDTATAAYYSLIGAVRVPPRYALGFTASRWGWQDRAYVDENLQNFRKGKYPIDAFITDFEFFTNVSDYNFPPEGFNWFGDFNFSAKVFPSPQEQLDLYHSWGFRMGGIRKPRLGNSGNLNFTRERGWLLPGGEMEMESSSNKQTTAIDRRSSTMYAERRNIDFSKVDARQWYASQQLHYLAKGVDFFWNDEGETDYFTFYWWNVAQIATVRMVDAERRFYSINRAWSPGTSRLGAVMWTGDINPSWDDLASTPGMFLNWGLAGAPYVACDVGGFTGNTNAQLLTRWFQLGALMPIMRVHSTNSATPHFPFLWGEPFASVMRDALNLRYQLLPYHYSLAHRLYWTGKLQYRTMAAEFPEDEKAVGLTSQWLNGDLLVAPIQTEDNARNVYLPAGPWFYFNSSKTLTGPTTLPGAADLAEIPIFTRPGALVLLAPVLQYTDQLPGGPLEVQVYGGKNGEFILMEDDGITTKYERAVWRATTFVWDDAAKALTWTVDDRLGGPASHTFTQVFATLFTGAGVTRSQIVAINGRGAIRF